MRIFFLTSILITFIFLAWCGALMAATHPINDHRTMYHPCGKPHFELDNMTSWFERRWKAEWKDLSYDEVLQFLAAKNLHHSDISGVRVFKSPMQPKFALVPNRLTEKEMNNEVVFTMRCVVQLNGFPLTVMSAEEIKEMFIKPFNQLGNGAPYPPEEGRPNERR